MDVQNEAWVLDLVVVGGVVALENDLLFELVQADIGVDIIHLVRQPLKSHLEINRKLASYDF